MRALADAVTICNRCGACQAVCPVYAETRIEPGVARGKVLLAAAILSGDLPVDREAAAAFSTCTTCMACEEACQSGVPVVDIVAAARAQVVEARGLPWVKRVVFGAYDPKGGGVEHGARVFAAPSCHHVPEVVGGVRETEAAAMLRAFFSARR